MSTRDIAKAIGPKLVTFTLVIVAVVAAYALYCRYADRPWTRDGQLRADTIKLAPRVEGYIVEVAVKDNQFVRKGELLFQIDPSSHQLAVNKAEVQLAQARENVEALEAAVRGAQAIVEQRKAAVTSAQGKVDAARAGIKSAEAATKEAESAVVSARAMIAQNKARLEEAKREAERAKRLSDERAGSLETAQSKAAAVDAIQAELDGANAGLSQAQAAVEKANAGEGEALASLITAQNGLAEAQAGVVASEANKDEAQSNLGQSGEANVRIQSAKVALEEAQLKLDWTKIIAPCDGYITNLHVKNGAFAVVGSPLVALVDSSSFRVHAYFKETKLRHIKHGDRAIVTLMSHRDRPIEGVVDSVGNAINPPNVSSTEGEMGVVPQIQPTFDWVRLAQRVPVTIRLKEVPDSVKLVSGTTASISIRPGNN